MPTDGHVDVVLLDEVDDHTDVGMNPQTHPRSHTQKSDEVSEVDEHSYGGRH